MPVAEYWRCAFLAATLWLSACAAPSRELPAAYHPPEAASGYSDKDGGRFKVYAVAAANPLASEAGREILAAGGSAVDAAVAVQMVLTLVEPQSSGIGGGAFLLHFDGKTVAAWDGRETAPAAVGEDLFLDAAGKPLPFAAAVVGGRAVGVPGTVRMLAAVHQRHGRLPWAKLFVPAITLAEAGFPVSPRLHQLLAADPHLRHDPAARAYFYDQTGQAWPVGHRLRNPALAATLSRIAREGADGLYAGPVAAAIVDKVRQHPHNPGMMSLADLAGYQVRERAALCHEHRGSDREYRVCGFPPPGSGAVAIGQILGILAETRAEHGGAAVPADDWLHAYAEAARLAFADRAHYLADPDFVSAPPGGWQALLAPAYLAERARLVGAQRNPAIAPGRPGGAELAHAPMPEQPERGTSHISIVDGNGQALAMTTTIEDGFGARQMVAGFLLNNELTDFSFLPRDAGGTPIANRVQPGKRPRSSMAPTLVFDKASGALVLSAGSPGGAMIIHYTARTLYGILNLGWLPQQAVTAANFGTTGGPLLLESGRFPRSVIQSMKQRGHPVREMPLTSGIQAIGRKDALEPFWLGGADPRREGVVLGH